MSPVDKRKRLVRPAHFHGPKFERRDICRVKDLLPYTWVRHPLTMTVCRVRMAEDGDWGFSYIRKTETEYFYVRPSGDKNMRLGRQSMQFVEIINKPICLTGLKRYLQTLRSVGVGAKIFCIRRWWQGI